MGTQRCTLTFLCLMAVAVTSGTARAAPQIEVNGSKVLPTRHGKAYPINAETGLELKAVGPTGVLLQLWAKNASGSMTVMLTRDDRYVSRSVVRFRKIGAGGPSGYPYAALLSFAVGEGAHQYLLTVSDTEVAVVPTLTRSVVKVFSAAPERDKEATDQTIAGIQTGKVTQDNPGGTTQNVPPQDPVGTTGDTTGASPTSGGEVIPDASLGVFAEADWTSSEQVVSGSPSAAPPRLEAAENTLQVGGMLFLRGRATQARSAGRLSEYYTSPTLADVYLDSTPNEHIRGYVRGRLKVDPSKADGTSVSLNQLWLKFDLGRVLYVTVGQQLILWGTGQFHNPTDFMNRARRDRFSLIDERTGVPLVKLHLPVSAINGNFYVVGSYQDIGKKIVAGAGRAEIAFGSNEVSLTAYGRTGERPRFGFDLSSSLPLVDVYAEVAARQGGNTVFWRGDFDPVAGVAPESYTQANRWFFQAVGRLQSVIPYSEEDRAIIGAEYFYNELGYPDASLYGWLYANGQYQPYFAGRHHVAGYLTLPSPGPLADTTILANVIANLNDKSIYSSLEARYLYQSTLTFTAAGTLQWGRSGEFNLGLDVPANPDIGIANAVAVPQARWEITIGMLLNI